jgi:acyl transferase domain-containing protein/NAD(P)H-dependent flavin oxidoreductase YrpB (nitropropane dioxygenase family)
MAPVLSITDLVIGVGPFGEPDARLAAAVTRAGGLGVLDLGRGDRAAREELRRLRGWTPGPFGVRVGPGCALRPTDLGPEAASPHTVVLGVATPWRVADVAARHRVLVEVTSLGQARDAVLAGAHGLIARGGESGGRVGELSSFVLLQQLLGCPEIDRPVWACGGIGPHTAAAAVVGGAAGVVLDSQLALLAECGLPTSVAAALRCLDGSETTVVAGHRVLDRRAPGFLGVAAARDRVGEGADAIEGISALLGARDLGSQLLPVGQDGFLAARFADRWGDAGGAVRAVRSAVWQAVEDDAVAGALRPGSPMARALGTRLPVAQGPMTRVSDGPQFARAVAAEGGLPFLALALADRQQARAMLSRAAATLGGRPWGVGVLGFAPEEIRRAQLDAVLEAGPSHAILAGGRPSQAEALERAGIRTFLHVPSPGLLRQFLDAGVRRFVFEGAECGGHVGPRNAFPLWEAQLAVLRDYLDGADEGTAGQLEVLFAGGVHDERSSAMVAALAAPLTARGAAVGVLMGTAYLFTEEAVRCQAVQPLFQRQVVAARRTVLLRTAPGHATRCVPSPFSDGYRTFEARLRAEGASDRRVWEELERLNVGRLRIASKGVERTADGDLAPVGEDRQRAEGMFMAGQVAVLRSATTGVAALHRAVAPGAAEFFAEGAAVVRQRLDAAPTGGEPAPPAPLDVAVVGMACMFPQAPDLATFWANILDGVDAVGEVPAERWDPAVHYSPERGGATISKWGGFLPSIPFDPLRYGIPPASLGSIEPVQLLALEAARRALDDAGYGGDGRRFDRSRTAVVFGAEAGSDLSSAATLRAVLPAYYGEVPAALDAELPRLTEDSFPGMLANVISGRIANRLDLGGANFTVDAACASSLAAVDVACKELVGGTSDLVLCGGADLHNGINDYTLFSSVYALSPTGRCRPFDRAADGIALGEGVACVVLKRLADAERDGDRIYGVIRGVGSSSDGRALGLTAPSPEGQRTALRRAYRNAGCSPADVGLVEAHGTGTVVGDRTELTVLGEVFTEAGAAAGGCTLGSVKSQIGHTKCAAGLAGLIKTVLALHTGVRPPTLHLERPGAAWREDTSPFVFHTRATPWAAPPAERVAGVSAFGFGGTNFHVVLAAHGDAVPPVHTRDAWPAELFLFRGADAAAAARAAEQTLELLGTGPDKQPWRLRDLARDAALRADTGDHPVRIAIVATDPEHLGEALRRAVAGEHDPAAGVHLAERPAPEAAPADAGKVAFLFPGQGSQRPGMLAEAFVAFPELQRYLQLGRAHAGVVYPPAAFDEAHEAAQHAAVTDTRVAQPALGMAGLAAHDLLTRAGVRPDMAAGHSYGELVALCAAGALSAEDLLELSGERAAAILAAAGQDPGAMAAVTADAREVDRVLRTGDRAGRVVVANHNAPDRTVVSGPTEAVDAAMRLLRDAGYGARRIEVACAFHSPVVAGAGERFARALADRVPRAPEFPVWANRTAAPYGEDPDAIRAELAAQIAAPVRFVDQIEAMYDAGARIFVEAGPGTVLTRLVDRILGDRPHRTVACEPRPGSGLRGFLDALARLAVAGVPVRAGWMFHGRDAVDAGRTAPAARPGWAVDGHLVRTAAGDPLPGALAPARRLREATMTGTGSEIGPVADRDALVAEFLRTSREMVAAQRDVLLTYFGAVPAATVAAPAPVAALPAPAELAPVTQPGPAVAASPPAPAAVTEADVLRMVQEIISTRTGYPIDMVEPDLDLEADLHIDSIKRTEIAGELAQRLGAGGGVDVTALDDGELEELARARTAAAVTGWLAARLAPTAAAAETQRPGAEPTTPEAPAEAGADRQVPAGEAPRRFVFTPVPLAEPGAPPDPASTLGGTRFLLLGDGGVATAVSARLTAYGAEVITRDAGEPLTDGLGPIDGVLYLDPLAASGPPALPDGFDALQAALRSGPRWLLGAAPADGGPGGDCPYGRAAGLRGFFRTVAREYPQTVARLVELDRAEPDTVAAALFAELLAGGEAPVVLRAGTDRHGLELVEAAPGILATTGAGPAGDGAAEAAALGLDRDSVVMLVGGARGITARFAAALAAAAGCRIELLGRTSAPAGPEDPATADAPDRAALRAVLARRAGASPAEVDRAAEAILAQREVAATMREIRGLGSEVRYRSVDVTAPDAVRQAVKEIHAEHDRLDGVVYGAGVIEDRLIAEKDPGSFRRVYDTKVGGADALLTALDELPDGPRFAVLFGSISAALGNRGQADYAAANDALQHLGGRWAARTGRRALTVHWGPWAPGEGHAGMVSPELAREYARRGIRLIDPEEGTLALLRELAWGDTATDTVVYTASVW